MALLLFSAVCLVSLPVLLLSVVHYLGPNYPSPSDKYNKYEKLEEIS
jgi:hypothetical protein